MLKLGIGAARHSAFRVQSFSNLKFVLRYACRVAYPTSKSSSGLNHRVGVLVLEALRKYYFTLLWHGCNFLPERTNTLSFFTLKYSPSDLALSSLLHTFHQYLEYVASQVDVRNISHVYQAAKSIAILMTRAAFQSRQSTRCTCVLQQKWSQLVTDNILISISGTTRQTALSTASMWTGTYPSSVYAVWPCVQQRHTTVEQQDIT